MKAAFVIKSLQVGGGGAERVLSTVANSLSTRRHGISVITLDSPDGRPFYPLLPAVQRIDLQLAPPGVPTPRGSLLRFLPRFRSAVASLKPDVVVAFMHSIYAPAALSLIGTRIPVIASEHCNAAHFSGRPLEARLTAIARDLAAAITVPTPELRHEFPAQWQKKTTILSNPIDLTAFEASPPAAGRPRHILLAVGRFMQEKNHVGLIESFARIAGSFPDWTLRIVGDGELRPVLEKKIASLNLGGRVELPGMSRDVASEYRAASFVVMPSLYESFGLATAEALASGRAVLGFAECVGTAELIGDGVNGILLPSNGNRVDLLADGLARLMSDAALRDRLGANGPQSVSRFGISGVVDQWEDLLISVVRGQGPGARDVPHGSNAG